MTVFIFVTLFLYLELGYKIIESLLMISSGRVPPSPLFVGLPVDEPLPLW